MSEDKTLIRKKLYKSGKGWVIGATVFAAMSLGASSVSADNNAIVPDKKDSKDNTVAPTQQDNKDNTVVPTQQDNKDNTVVPTQQDNKDNTVVPTQQDNKDNTVVPTQQDNKDNTVAPTQQDNKDNTVAPTQQDNKDNTVAPTQQDNKDNTVVPDKITNNGTSKDLATNKIPDILTGGYYKEKDNGFVYITKDGNQVTGLQNIEGNLQYFNDNGTQVKGTLKTLDNTAYYLDKNNGNAKTFTKISAGSYIGKSGNWQYINNKDGQPIKGLYDVQGHLQYFDLLSGNQIKNQLRSIDGVTYYFDQNTGNATTFTALSSGQYSEKKDKDSKGDEQSYWVYAEKNDNPVKGIYDINGSLQYFDLQTGAQLKGGTATIDDVTYYFEQNQGNLVSIVKQATDGQYKIENNNVYYVDNQGNTLKGLYAINGKLNFFDMTSGAQLKGTSTNVDGIYYYFDKDSGIGQYQFNLINSTQNNDAFTKHNVANTYNKDSFTNTVDGFLTADTWYRPIDIFKNGTNWVTSTEKDFRPLITIWWPNKNVQVNYLQLMQSEGLLNSSAAYDINSDQFVLNEAAKQAQINIEKKISKEGNTNWLNYLLYNSHDNTPSFVKQQYIWNSNSEYHTGWFQGGYFAYQNNSLTPYANSDYRKFIYNEFLLANDIDNSNPIVQVEDLNWLYYLMNFGTNTGNDDQANFDSIRIDAIGFMNQEVAKKSYELLNSMYQLSSSEAVANKHISLVEAGTESTVSTENNDALIESNWRPLMKSSLSQNVTPGIKVFDTYSEYQNFIGSESSEGYAARVAMSSASLSALINDGIDRTLNNSVKSSVSPNYTIVHAHDKDVQDTLINVMKIVNNDPSISLTSFTLDQLKKGIKAFYEDQRSSSKKYNQYNIPSAYALMLTNKDTVPRIFYGDLYQDDGQYMETPSIYYNAIETMMEARVKYVSGGQTMTTTKLHNSENNQSQEVITSVRFGKNLMNANDISNSSSRAQGIGVVASNNSSLHLSSDDKIVLSMGKAHKNQLYRALLLTSDHGIEEFKIDRGAPVALTDNNGDLTFTGNDINGQTGTAIKGYLNPQVAGYLAVWVPVGASEDQDARTPSSESKNDDGKILHSNAALDSQLIYEGFSNFQPMPTNSSEYTNVIISKNANLFHSWGITNFELAPQYRSSNGKNNNDKFIDSIVQNGYGLSDRYDLGFETPTKYGTDKDLRNAIKSLHQTGMTVMADYVANQIYGLNKNKEVVSTTRVTNESNIINSPYGTQLNVVNTIGGGKYQEMYGGKYLGTLKTLYPNLFVDNNGNQIDSTAKIKEWSAKYMNGTNVLGLGMGYVLKDWSTGQYFNISNKDGNIILPTQLLDTSNTLGTKTDYTAFVASTLRQDGLYTNGPLGTKVKDQNNQPLDVTSAGNTESHNHQKVQVTRQYTDSKGVVWNLINFNNQTVWVDNNALVTVDFTPNKTKTKQFVKFGIRQGRDKYDSFYTSAPYGQTQSNWLATTRTHQGNLVEVAGQYKVGSTTWSLVLLDGKQVWIDSRALDTNFTHDTNLKLLINSAKRNDGMYLNNPYGKTGYKRNASTRSYNENIVTVSQQYYDDKGIIWNLITLDGKKLWVDSRAFATSITKDLKQRLLIDSRHRNDGMYLNAPYRASEAQRTASTRSYNGQLMTVTKQYKDVYGMTWNLINLNGQQVWVDNRAFTTAYRTKVNQNLYINSNTRTDGMYMTAPYRASGAKKATTSKSHNGQRVQVTEQYRDVYGVTWSLANVNGKKLWVDNRALTQTITTNVSRHVKINSKKRTDGIYTNAPYGDKNAKWLASTKKYNGKKLTATKEYKNAKGVTWYLVTLDNRRVWIDQRAFN
ncbi:glycoside hydrolase family 70 protein [Leuconostoc carnosum]|uniref:glycoside hydrolase family 70 protein n=1 Tax=Leuconostoc carnosum TaxID=1252 RepID=UPI00345CB499